MIGVVFRGVPKIIQTVSIPFRFVAEEAAGCSAKSPLGKM